MILIDEVKCLFPAALQDQILMVGGMVRDILQGVESQDVDLAAALPPEALLSLGFRLVESKSTPNIYFRFTKTLGKVEVTWLPSLEALGADLAGRDFTINAMAMALDGTVIDPLGGRQDLERRVLRTCSSHSLRHDPVRIFRAFRFESDGWRLDAAAEGALGEEDWSPRMTGLPVERFSQEMLKALAKPDPARFFRRMLQFGVGREFLPELFRMPEVPAGPPEHHPEGDLFTHSMQVLERMAATTGDPCARFCALFHDLGKLATPSELWPKHHGHDHAGELAAPELCRRLRLSTAFQRALKATCKLHNSANRWEELRDSTRIRLALDARKAGIDAFLPQVAAADFKAEMAGWGDALEVAALNSAQLGIEPDLFQGDPEKLQQVIMQRRVEVLRKRRGEQP